MCFERYLDWIDPKQCSPIFEGCCKVKIGYLRSLTSEYDPALIQDNRNPLSE